MQAQIQISQSTVGAFEAKFLAEPTSGCWLWEGSTDGHYGEIQVAGRKVKAHRLSWMIHRGEIPAGLNVLHQCDNTFCVNPNHLFVGTKFDNMRDCAAKGRNAMQRHPERSTFSQRGRVTRPFGERHGMAVLTEAAVKDMHRLALNGASSADVARIHNIHPGHARKILAGKAWARIAASIRGGQS